LANGNDKEIKICVPCATEISMCLECLATSPLSCTRCLFGYYYDEDNVKCKLCKEVLPDCIECSNSNTCTKCASYAIKNLSTN